MDGCVIDVWMEEQVDSFSPPRTAFSFIARSIQTVTTIQWIGNRRSKKHPQSVFFSNGELD